MSDTGTDTTTPASGEGKTFTEEQVQAMIEGRLAQWKRNNPAKPDDYADLQAQAKELATLKASQLSETERLQAERDAAKAEAEAARAEAAAATSAAAEEKIRAAILGQAALAKAIDPTDVLAGILLDATKKNTVTIGDDGQVTGAKEAVEAYVSAKPHLVGAPQTPRPDPAQGAPGNAGAPGSVSAGRERARQERANNPHSQGLDGLKGLMVQGA